MRRTRFLGELRVTGSRVVLILFVTYGKKVLEMPIPRYRASMISTERFVDLGATCRTRAMDLAASPEFPKSLARRRGQVRAELAAALLGIDTVVKQLMP